MILNNIIEKSRERGLNTISLEVRESNKAARSLYESSGFGIIAKRPGYYNNPVEDGLIMSYKI